MDSRMSIGMMNSEQCHTDGCSIDASNICKRERTIICHTCAAILHSNCHLSIKDEAGFIMNSVELLKDLLKKINPKELVCTNNILDCDLAKQLQEMQDKIRELENQIAQDGIKLINADIFVKKTKELTKNILNSNVYKVYIDYKSRLRFSNDFTKKLEDSNVENEMQATIPKSCLNAKDTEQKFRDELLESVKEQIDKKIHQEMDKVEKECGNKIDELKNMIEQEAYLAKKSLKESEERMSDSQDKMQQEIKMNLNKMRTMLNEETIAKIVEIKNNLEVLEAKIENKQNLYEKQTDFEMLVEKSNKETEENSLKLENRVDEFEKKLLDVVEFLNEKRDKEKYQIMINQLELKDDQYLINEFEDYKEFPIGFKKTREVYSKLGQFIYSHQLDSKRPIKIKRGELIDGTKYIYFGQLKEGTSECDGVGIRVDSDGAIIEGCWKNDNINGFGRYIYEDETYYIGESKDGKKHGQGTYYWTDGRKYVGEWKNNKRNGQGTIYYTDGRKYGGEWKDDKYHGKGTEYAADGQISREGVWADNKYVGKG